MMPDEYMEYREYSKKHDGMTIVDSQGNELYNPLYDVDESSLSKVDRLGLAYCRFNNYHWDEIVCPKPEGFDDLPNHDRYGLERISHPFIMSVLSKLFPKKYAKKVTKYDLVMPIMRGIESEIGEPNTSRCHWVYGMKKTEEEWREWYYTERFKGLDC
ncbi:hypothetical protein D1159_03570 [Pseudoflavonifractor sp. 524-17]|uniref:hypothetical protein n=1 Tax=Pseudoflavonifractor sp. 524-17 TaxID=2304577 RepID=UPI00137A9E31|nr:hypothetical protein [Pseudoflavonifractor sp. 524-17]NCE63678.1 hypothetical protein [Pseudoflavonifractor sp. 524-17]